MTQAQSAATSQPGNPTILVVEDEVLVRAMISEELRFHGYTVIEAASADEALAVLRSHLNVDMVVTDKRMPGALDGAGLVRTLRSEFPAVKIVMAAVEAPEAAVRGLLDGFVSKPFSPSQLSRFVRTLIASPLKSLP